MTTLVIIVHSRKDNLQHWIDCLKLCPPVKTVIIHNDNGDDYSSMCNGYTYIKRANNGYDIGAMKDVFTGKINIGEWDKLIWCCDDTLPMSTDFIQQYESKHTEGVVCMDLSPYVRPHIRTTGFMIDRDTASKIAWQQIVTKEDCYKFEHRAPRGTFLAQVQQMRRPAFQLRDRQTSPLWDIGYHRKLDRLKEHEAIFGPVPNPEANEQKEITTIICPIYKSFPAVISSLIMQTNPNWRLKLIHDGPSDGGVEAYIHAVNDDRISYEETATHRGAWGHSIRAEWLQKVTSKYVMITNPDNYYAPTFIEKAIRTISKKSKTIAAFCSLMTHSYVDWAVQSCQLKRGFLDCGGVLMRTKEVQAVGWHSMEHSADWHFFEAIAKRYGKEVFATFPGMLFIHN